MPQYLGLDFYRLAINDINGINNHLIALKIANNSNEKVDQNVNRIETKKSSF